LRNFFEGGDATLAERGVIGVFADVNGIIPTALAL